MQDAGLQGSLLPEEPPDPVAQAQAALLRGSPGHYSEWHGALTDAAQSADGDVSPLWRRFLDATGVDGWRDLSARAARMHRRVHDDGATYNVYADGEQTQQVWPLELLPLLIAPEEWAAIERGVNQRARLLNATLADVYGAQTLLDDALLPPSLVLGHPQYLRPMYNCRPPGDVFLHVAAFDLVRGPEGAWWVAGQRTQAPSGLGYVLENRLIIRQQFPEAFQDLRVQRLAAAFQALVAGLKRLCPGGDRGRIVLLTPGPHNETYFEHVFLARYLGITLVEGGDLTVRTNRLYLKTLRGLERVHGVLRRVDDDYLDPLELRADSALGVPGLLDALRAGEVMVANAPGTGFLESPGLAAFWPGVSRRLLGEELLLPATTSWWCGEAAVWSTHALRLNEFVVAPTFPSSAMTTGFDPMLVAEMSADARKALIARIGTDPAAHTLQARVRPSETPVWQRGMLEPRPAVLRVFALTDGEGGYRVLPGGLTRVAASRDATHDPWLSMQRGSASADTWVLTDGPVDTTSLLPQPLAPADLAGWHRPVTSRAAENLFWLGRYSERADNTVRLARLTLESLNSGTPPVLRALTLLAQRYGLVSAEVPGADQSRRVFERSLLHTLGQADGAQSVAFNLGALRASAMALRERLSQEHWSLIHDVGDQFRSALASLADAGSAGSAGEVLAVLRRVATQLSAITGAQTDRMTRDDGWRLLSVGRQLERLDFLSHALALGFEQQLHDRDDGFALLLALFDSTITYRAQFQGRREVPPLLHLLVLDTDNPRSLAWVARTMRERFIKLTRHDAAWAVEVSRTLPRPDEWSLEALSTPNDDGRHGYLIDVLQACGGAAQNLSDVLSRRFFSHVGPANRLVWL